jgi:hypothetical protein
MLEDVSEERKCDQKNALSHNNGYEGYPVQ